MQCRLVNADAGGSWAGRNAGSRPSWNMQGGKVRAAQASSGAHLAVAASGVFCLDGGQLCDLAFINLLCFLDAKACRKGVDR